MARKTSNYIVNDENRDNGKVFLITEMPASKGESWAFRAILALIANGTELPEGFENSGMSGMAEIGIKALSGLKWEVAEPLLNEMLECVQIIPDPTKPHVVRKLFDEDIEEIMTRVKLRMEVWALHTDFLKAAVRSASVKVDKAEPRADDLPNM